MRLFVDGATERPLCRSGSVWRRKVRPPTVLAFALVAVALFATAAAAAPGDLLFTIKSPNPQAGANFGYRLAAVDGDILVGAFTEDLGLPIDAQGRAYLFDGETGKQTQTFDLPDPMDLDLFASSLTGGDGRVFISARGVTSQVHAFDAGTGEHLFAIEQPSQSLLWSRPCIRRREHIGLIASLSIE